jgi:hypothetical protein
VLEPVRPGVGKPPPDSGGWQGSVTRSCRPQPIVTRPGVEPLGTPCWSGPLTSAFSPSYSDIAFAKLRISLGADFLVCPDLGRPQNLSAARQE